MPNEKASVESGVGADTEQELKDQTGVGSGDQKQDEPDYKALLEKAIEERDNYKTALTQKRQLRKQNIQEEPEVAEDPNDVISQVRKVVQEEVIPVITTNKVQTQLEKLVSDPDKRKLVHFYYENRIRQTGTSDDAIQSDLQTALDLADAQKLRKVNTELARKNMQEKVPPMAGSSADRGVERANHQFSSEQVKALEATARNLGADPKKFVENAWKNQRRG